MSHSRVTPLTRATAILVLLALVAGLPQFLVLCTPSGSAPRIEFACAAGCCHDDPAGAEARSDGDPSRGFEVDAIADAPRRGDRGPGACIHPHRCVHLALGCELMPQPPRAVLDVAPAAADGDSPLVAAPRRDAVAPSAWIDATEPPRPKPILLCLSSTVLQQ